MPSREGLELIEWWFEERPGVTHADDVQTVGEDLVLLKKGYFGTRQPSHSSWQGGSRWSSRCDLGLDLQVERGNLLLACGKHRMTGGDNASRKLVGA